MRLSDIDGQVAYALEESWKDYENPQGRLFTFEGTYDAVTYVSADIVGTVCAEEVNVELNSEDLVSVRNAH